MLKKPVEIVLLLPAWGSLVAIFDAHPLGALILAATAVLIVGIKAFAPARAPAPRKGRRSGDR